jgi:hypothetical protein
MRDQTERFAPLWPVARRFALILPDITYNSSLVALAEKMLTEDIMCTDHDAPVRTQIVNLLRNPLLISFKRLRRTMKNFFGGCIPRPCSFVDSSERQVSAPRSFLTTSLVRLRRDSVSPELPNLQPNLLSRTGTLRRNHHRQSRLDLRPKRTVMLELQIWFLSPTQPNTGFC